MGRGFFCFFLFLALLISGGRAALTFNDIWNLALPSSNPKPEAITSRPSTSANGEVDHPKKSVDFGTNGWPWVYYIRRDTKGTIDWGTLAWPYIYYSERNSKDDVDAATVGGRKGGAGFKP